MAKKSKKNEGADRAPASEPGNREMEAKLWASADALRNNMDAAEYKHVVLGLIFLKYISDAFEAKHAELEQQEVDGADPEDPDEYRRLSIFWVPPEARWTYLKSMAPQPTIGLSAPGAIKARTQGKAQIFVLTKEEGGRHTPFASGYQPQFFFGVTDVSGTIHLADEAGVVSPGDQAEIHFDLGKPVGIEQGMRFAIREGGKTVGAGLVTDVIA